MGKDGKAKIERINALAHKAKTQGLTPEEKQEQTALRREYLADIRASLQAQLAGTIVVEPDGSRHPLLKNPLPKP